ncbi:synaptotagmin-5-like [Brienomyrus brachyistius]|uniref:synaptotagmin-5-like n=1 Tax=Brienomyrus brachyistius TaxID=42636 RepID=UPI0020B3131C|nr:synaptotagmin-5-like [Brienomyrus brachyistius]
MVHLEVHLQIVLGVALAVFCFCLLLGCFLAWRRRKSRTSGDKEAPPSPPQDLCSPVVATVPVRQQYEELDGDVCGSPCSRSDGSAPPGCQTTPVHESQTPAPPELGLHLGKTGFPLRRLSFPAASGSAPRLHRHGCASLPSAVPKLGLVSRTRRAVERRYTVMGDSLACSERSRLTAATGSPLSSYLALEPTVSPAPTPTDRITRPAPLLQFSLLFSPARGTLTVTVLSLSGGGRRLGGAILRASLPPLCPAPVQALARRRSLGPELRGQSVLLPVGSQEELRGCSLQLAVVARDFSGLRESAVGQLELPCSEVDWEPDRAITYSRGLQPAKSRLKKSQSSHDSLSRGPRDLGQLFILLQYQSPAHRVKVMVRKAESMARLSRMPGAPDHYVVIKLRHKGTVIETKETKGASGYNAVWNAPFLFDLPQGDITQLALVLEFVIMQGRVFTKSSMLGRVLIGSEAPEEGKAHWVEMYSRDRVETARWHAIQPESRQSGEEP